MNRGSTAGCGLGPTALVGVTRAVPDEDPGAPWLCRGAGPLTPVSEGPSATPARVAGPCGTCADGLPAHGERGPGLDGVHGDRAVVVGPGPPGQLGRGVRDFIDGHGLGGPWGTCRRARPSGAGGGALPHLVPDWP